MKQTRLLEIIREEISSALTEAGLGDQITVLQKQKDSIEKQKAPLTKKEADVSKKIADLEKKQADAELKAGAQLEETKSKKLAEKYQIDEEVINEMASIKQLKTELSRQGKEAELKAIAAAERAALDTLKADPTITSDGRLKGYVPTLKKELLNTHNIKLQDLLSTVAGKAEDDGVKFSSDIATNTIEKDAANQLTGKEPGQRGRKAAEKPAKTEKAPKAKTEKAPKAEPKAEPADDEDAAASKAAGSDETAKELGSTPEEKKVKFNQFLASVKKNKDDKAKIDGILKLAKDKFKFAKTMMDDLKRAAGREVEA
jgi:hypothetical protein